MKKKSIAFIIFCMVACLIPLAGMTVRPTTESTENRRMSTFPSALNEDGSLNKELFSEFDTYFNEHFSFRNELLYADARIQGDVFGVSSVDSVVFGSDGWLYYRSTLDDYLGSAPLSDRELYCIRQNLEIARNYAEEQGSSFLLVVPPNKNTLYGKNMPYYDSIKTGVAHNIDRLQPLLKKNGIPYADLTDMFRNESETLYLKRDSHWNAKGALMAYNLIMDELDVAHDNYAESTVLRAKNEDGDLNRMLYTFYGEKEMNYYYDIGQDYSYVTDTESVEDAWIETECPNAQGTLLMFRDSFGNTLIPLFANQFSSAWFTKEGQYRLEKLLDEYNPDAVVFEKVERNLKDFLVSPPILTAPEEEITPDESKDSDTSITAEPFEFDINYCVIRGAVDASLISETTDVYVQINGKTYKAYLTGEKDYTAFFRKDKLPDEDTLDVCILVNDNGKAYNIAYTTIQKGDLEH